MCPPSEGARVSRLIATVNSHYMKITGGAGLRGTQGGRDGRTTDDAAQAPARFSP